MQRTLFGTALRGALILVVPCVAFAAQPAATQSDVKPAKDVKSTTPAQTQMRAYIDPETGRLVGHPVTADQQRAAQQAVKAPDQSVVQAIVHADGSTEYILNGAADSEMIATVGKDGKVHTHCTDPTHNHALDQHPATTEAADER
jgi:hypothetical protein